MSFLTIRNLTVRVRKGPVILRNVTLEVAAGQVHGLVGESGAGKSMIGKAVLGTLPRAMEVVSGEIRLDGTDLQALAPDARVFGDRAPRLANTSCLAMPGGAISDSAAAPPWRLRSSIDTGGGA